MFAPFLLTSIKYNQRAPRLSFDARVFHADETKGLNPRQIITKKTMNQRISHCFTVLILSCAALASTLAVTSARAATITVTSTGDTIASDGVTTLREAITSANATVAVADTINFNINGAGTHTIQLASALPQVVSAITITGPTDKSVTVRGEGSAHLYTLFDVNTGLTAIFQNLVLSNGQGGNGGAIISRNATVTATNCTFNDNVSTSQGGAI